MPVPNLLVKAGNSHPEKSKLTILEESEIRALIALLDDPDQQIYEHVSDKLISMGPEIIGLLEDAYTSIPDNLTQQRIENIIHAIQFALVKSDLAEWVRNDSDDLVKGLLIINRYQYPLADEEALMSRLQQMRKDAWLGLNVYLSPLEQVDAVNQVLFGQYAIKGVLDDNDPRYGFLTTLLESSKGNHFIIGMVYLAITQQLGLPLLGVLLPNHFILVRTKEEVFDFSSSEYLRDQVLFYINPFNKGLSFSEREIRNYIQKAGLENDDHYFLPASNVQVMTEYLHMLHFQFTQQESGWKSADMEELIRITELG